MLGIWNQGCVLIVFALYQWKVWGTKVGLSLGHKLVFIRPCVTNTWSITFLTWYKHLD